MLHFYSASIDLVVELEKCHSGKLNEATMKIFISSAYIDLIEYCKVISVE